MAHEHPIIDQDKHFVIDPITRKIKSLTPEKNSLVRYDHNSERFTFEIPRYVDGHDMSLCNVIQIHYINISSNKTETNTDVYEVDDMFISNDDNKVIFSWLISKNATQYFGSLNFAIRFACTIDETIEYAWHTDIYSGISISNSINNGVAIVEEYSDVLEKWRFILFGSAVESSDPENPTSLRNLESGTHSLSGDFIPYDGSTDIITFKDGLQVEVIREDDKSSIQMLYPKDNSIKQFVITDDSIEINTVYLNNLSTVEYVNTETERATQTESTIATNLSSEVTRAAQAESKLTSDLSSEVTRAKQAESKLTSDLSSEVTRATLAESKLTADLNGHTHQEATTTSAGFMSASDKTKLDSLSEGGNDITIDSELSDTSTNAIQNKAVYEALSDKANNDHTHQEATTTSAGFMSASDKTKLDSMSEDVNKVTIDSELSDTSTNPVQNKVIYNALSDKADNEHTHSDVTTSDSGFMSASDKSKLDGISIGAEVNQNSFSNVVIGSTSIAAYSKTDTLTIESGSNITITPNEDNKKITIDSSHPSIDISDDTTSEESPLSGETFTAVDSVTRDSYGHVTEVNTKTVTLPNVSSVIVDSELSDTSTNAIQNKAVYEALATKVDGTDGIATKASQDANGNVISDTYALKSLYGDTTINVGRKADTEVGKYSTAEGIDTTASGIYSHAEGKNTTAYNESSHAEGYRTTAIGIYSHAEGSVTTASGHSAHAEGGYTTASGEFAHAEGGYTIALQHQHAQGHYNDETKSTENTWEGTSAGTAFVIGNGTESTRSNAFRVTGEGRAIGKTSFASSGADYAEYFEWKDGNPYNEDRVGYFVTFDDGKYIRKANSDDYILGIVSGLPCVIGNNDECWMKQFEMDEFGRFIYETTCKTDEKTGETKEITFYKVNPDFDKTKPYVHREQRKEWSAIGIVGVLSVYDDGSCIVNGYCKCSDGGIATACEKGIDTFRVIERITDNIIKVVIKP